MVTTKLDLDDSDFECLLSTDESREPLTDLYSSILSKHSSLIKASPKDLSIRLANILLHFRLWGVEINVESGSLAILDEKYPEQASSVNTLLHHVLHSLYKVEEEVSDGNTTDPTSI
jgi:hypothetical protein